MLHSRFFLAAAVSASLVLACSVEDAPFGESGSGAASGTGGAALGDMPCDVAEVLSNCVSCHAGANPSGRVRIASRADLAAPSPDDASQTVAQRSLARMSSATEPMPPTGQLSDAQIQAFESWVTAGMPTGSCDGVGGGGPVALTCTSNQYWPLGDEESPDMRPGVPCIDCHAKGIGGERGPSFIFAGTVFLGLHDEDDCFGSTPAGTTVVVTDAVGRVFEVAVRPRGNFFEEEQEVTYPIRAEVRRGGQVLAMKDPVPTGDCNTCHSAEGQDGAPGRIIAP
jgi:mono/diheme cytochrome c family protein